MLTYVLDKCETEDDRQFMESLYLRYERLLFSTARKYISDFHTCEDVIQDSLIKLIKKIPVLRQFECCTLTAYIVSTVRNTAINHLRRTSRYNEILNEHNDYFEKSPGFETLSLDELMILKENHSKFLQLWESLNESDRILLEIKYILDCSDEEIAEIIGCKPASVRMKLTRARRRASSVLCERKVAK